MKQISFIITVFTPIFLYSMDGPSSSQATSSIHTRHTSITNQLNNGTRKRKQIEASSAHRHRKTQKSKPTYNQDTLEKNIIKFVNSFKALQHITYPDPMTAESYTNIQPDLKVQLNSIVQMVQARNKKKLVLSQSFIHWVSTKQMQEQELIALQLKCALYIAERIDFKQAQVLSLYYHVAKPPKIKTGKEKLSFIAQLVAAQHFLLRNKKDEVELILHSFLNNIGYKTKEDKTDTTTDRATKRLLFMREVISILPKEPPHSPDDYYLSVLKYPIIKVGSRATHLHLQLGFIMSLPYMQQLICPHALTKAFYDMFDVIETESDSLPMSAICPPNELELSGMTEEDLPIY